MHLLGAAHVAVWTSAQWPLAKTLSFRITESLDNNLKPCMNYHFPHINTTI